MDIQWLQQIERLLRSGQHGQASSETERAAAGSPNDVCVLLARFQVAYLTHHPGDAIAAADTALQAARAVGDRLGEANALVARADALRMLGQHRRSSRAADAAATAARDAPDKLAEANALRSKADALRMRGRYRWSLRAANEAVAAALAAGNKLAEANSLGSKADALRMLGQHRRSSRAADAAAAAARDAPDKLAEANALRSKADALRMRGRYRWSLRAANEAVAAARTARNKLAEGNALASRVMALSELNRANKRGIALKELAALDPEQAKLLAFYPLGVGWSQKGRQIFSSKQNREREMRKVLSEKPTTPPLPDGFDGQLQVLRKWASYTTAELIRPAEDSRDRDRGATGGGYFLWWQGWGLVIDPGLGFGGAFRDANLVPRNISAVVATHHHIDHTGDMLPILTCLFEINQGPLPRDIGKHHVDFLLAPGAFSAFADVAAYVPGVRSFQLLRSRGLLRSGGLLRSEERVPLPLPDGSQSAMITAVRAEHRDLTGRTDAAIGLRVDLPNSDGQYCRVGLSGDTKFSKDTAEAFKDVDLMIVHIGSVYEYDIGASKDPPSHLGFLGVVQLLRAIKAASTNGWDPLVLISEWGEELGPDRSMICELIAKSAGVKRVFPAELRQSLALKPGKAQPICAREHQGRRRTADHWGMSDSGSIEYLCDDHDHH